MSKLFEPIRLRSLEVENRIVIPPMCQYAAVDGNVSDWHTVHLGHLALSGAGLLIVEATAVEPEGRISPGDVGLWDDRTKEALEKVIQTVKNISPIRLGIQLAHAGRKASTFKPWERDGGISLDNGGWKTVAPSSVPYSEKYTVPEELTRERIDAIVSSFAEAAGRAAEIGFDVIEIHAAHGYLLHEFLSPLSNKRTDDYGGSLDDRMRMTLDVFKAVRNVFPADKPVGIRISAVDWVDGGWNLDDSIVLSRELERLGCDYIHVSGGGLSDKQQLSVGPGYQVPYAQKIKENIHIPVIAVGLITDPEQAETILRTEQADMIAVGRGILYDPRWPWHAAAELGERIVIPNQYLRSAPHRSKDLFKGGY